MQKRRINVVPYDPNWIKIFESHADELRKALSENVVEVYHVGSTSVPGLCAKPEVDIMCVVKNLKTITKPLESIGYTAKGEFNLPLRLFFSRKTPDDINLHVVNENSGEIEWNLCFQNYLRENKKAREMYSKVKLDLVSQNPDGFDILHNSISEYTTSKGEVIRKIGKLAGFNGYRFVIAFNDYEIGACKTLLNLEKITLENPHIFHLCLYKGTEITAASLLEVDEDFSIAEIKKTNAVDEENKAVLLSKIKEWLKFKGTALTEKLILTKPSEEYVDEIKAFRDEFVAARPKGAEKEKYAGLDLNGAGMLWQFENPHDWIEHSRLCENKNTLPDENLVTASQYIFVRESDKKIVGVIHFRHYFNDFLEKYGGHIGYSICPSERRKGYGTLMLSECLKEIKKYSNLEKVLLTCNDTNEASKKTIIANGGVYENTVYCEPNDCNLERYWIDFKKASNVTSAQVLDLYNWFKENDIVIWIDGGWCVDALIGKQTRSHEDLDIAVHRKDNIKLRQLLENNTYKEEWRDDSSEFMYVMKSEAGQNVDIHAFEYDENDKNIYGIPYPFGSLTGTGIIDGQKVNCINPKFMFGFKNDVINLFRTNSHQPREKDLHDMRVLSEKFGFELPSD